MISRAPLPFCNNLRKGDQVLCMLTKRRGIVANDPRENSRQSAVTFEGTNSFRYLFVKNLRLIVDGKPEDVPPCDGVAPGDVLERVAPKPTAPRVRPISDKLWCKLTLIEQTLRETMDEIRRIEVGA